jgi:hypothetical protein
VARVPHPDTVRAVGEILDGFYGLRYVQAIADTCELPVEGSRKAFEAALIALLPRIRNRYSGDPLAHLTLAIARALFSGMPGSPSTMIRYCRESICIDRFVERVSEREEPYIEDCLRAELFYFFADDDPGPYRAAMSMPGA